MVIERSVAIELAQQAGQILRAGWGKTDLRVEMKGVTNPVTEIDQRSEVLIKEGLMRATPSYGIVAEESDAVDGRADARWIVDPLDGTINYMRAYPYVAVSIGLEKQGELVLGVIYNPILDELYVAEKGGGATLNGRAIHVSSVDKLGQAVIASGFPYDAWDTDQDNLEEWGRFVKRSMSIRCDGSAAIDLCFVACGRLDGYYERGTMPYDVAAGAVIVREAGGLASDYLGGNEFMQRREIITGNPAMHAAIMSTLRG